MHRSEGYSLLYTIPSTSWALVLVRAHDVPLRLHRYSMWRSTRETPHRTQYNTTGSPNVSVNASPLKSRNRDTRPVHTPTHTHSLTTPHPRVHAVTGCFSSLSQLWFDSVSVIKVRWLQQYTPKAPTGLVNFKCLDIDTSWPGMVTLWWVRMACWCFSNILD